VNGTCCLASGIAGERLCLAEEMRDIDLGGPPAAAPQSDTSTLEDASGPYSHASTPSKSSSHAGHVVKRRGDAGAGGEQEGRRSPLGPEWWS
jgi:hypothetical protein